MSSCPPPPLFCSSNQCISVARDRNVMSEARVLRHQGCRTWPCGPQVLSRALYRTQLSNLVWSRSPCPPVVVVPSGTDHTTLAAPLGQQHDAIVCIFISEQQLSTKLRGELLYLHEYPLDTGHMHAGVLTKQNKSGRAARACHLF